MALAAIIWAASAKTLRWGLLLPLAALAATLLQIVPLPDSLLLNIAPISTGAWKVAHEGLPGARGSISIDPAATATAARRLLLGLATVAVVADLGRQQSFRRWLAAAVGTAGAIVVLLGLLFPVTSKERILLGFVDLKGPIDYWLTPLNARVQTAGFGYPATVKAGDLAFTVDEGASGDGFGPYIVSNHFAGALCLTIPMVLAAWLAWSRQRIPAAAAYAGLTVGLLFALWVSGGLASSRAGAVALGFAGIVFLALSARNARARRIGFAATAASAAAVLFMMLVLFGWFPGLADSVPAGVREKVVAILRDPRVDAAKVAMRMFFASPLLGTGLSTFGDIYPRFNRGPHMMYFAHNDYAQLLAETGLVGGGFAVAFAWMLFKRLRGFLRAPETADSLINAGAWAGVAGIAAHSAFDWNLHVPANAFLAAILTGLAAASAPLATATQGKNRPAIRMSAAIWPRAVFIAACGLSVLLLGRDALSEQAQGRLRGAITAERIAVKDPTRPSAIQRVAAAVKAGESAAKRDPANAHLAAAIAQGCALLATEDQPIDEANRYRKAVEQWAKRARLHCAEPRGLPEPAPQLPAQLPNR
jgi:hypothetical protein